MQTRVAVGRSSRRLPLLLRSKGLPPVAQKSKDSVKTTILKLVASDPEAAFRPSHELQRVNERASPAVVWLVLISSCLLGIGNKRALGVGLDQDNAANSKVTITLDN